MGSKSPTPIGDRSEDAARRILEELASGRIPESVPAEVPFAEELGRLADTLAEIERFVLSLSQGDLSQILDLSGGPLVGSLKALQANLRHLTWQTQMIASGHFEQRVEFMGDFAAAFNAMVERLQASYGHLTYLSSHDTLTGLYNRAYFDTELDRFGRGRVFPVSLLVADVDGLKTVNDTRGHAFGDALLRKAAVLLSEAFRAEDVVARIGGDEFGAILPGVDSATVQEILARIRTAEAATSGDEDGLPVSFSLGFATAAAADALAGALREADERMYADQTARRARRG
jgi:diguanylate cyclase (GGDEF)-like protein